MMQIARNLTDPHDGFLSHKRFLIMDRDANGSGRHPDRSAPRYLITDKGKQFWYRSFKNWCKRRGIRPRYGRVGEPASIAIVERFI